MVHVLSADLIFPVHRLRFLCPPPPPPSFLGELGWGQKQLSHDLDLDWGGGVGGRNKNKNPLMATVVQRRRVFMKRRNNHTEHNATISNRNNTTTNHHQPRPKLEDGREEWGGGGGWGGGEPHYNENIQHQSSVCRLKKLPSWRWARQWTRAPACVQSTSTDFTSTTER